MMTMHVLSAGDGYAYYTSETATGDVARENGRELGDYYTADGNPPGVWVGSGLDAVGVKGTVTEEQMKALFGEGLHPDADRIIREAQAAGKTAAQAQDAARLGRGYYNYEQGATGLRAAIDEGYARFERTEHREPDAEERRAIRVREGAQAFREAKGRPPADKEELGRFITAASRPTQQAVAGFDLVFSPAKSVSTLWGLGDNDTRKVIEDAHEQAIADTVKYLEDEAIATRAGRNGVAQIDVEGGLIATRFRHHDSRTGDPQLHDHLVVANKVKGSDGKWRTIDSKLLHRQGVAASEFYNARVMDFVTERLGVTTELREVTRGKRPVVEIAGVDDRLTKGFSTRSASIKDAMKKLEQDYRHDHGRAPDLKARIALAQQATLDTRPQKETARSLSALRDSWRARAIGIVGDRVVDDVVESAKQAGRDARAGTSGTRETITTADASARVVETVSEHHAVWGPHMIEAEARRFVQAERTKGNTVEGTVEQITKHALTTDSITVTPPAPHGAFQPLTRKDGTSIYEHKGTQLLTSQAVLVAEDTLLDAARDRTIRPVSRETFDRIASEQGQHLDAGQRALAGEFATSSNRLVVGTGPAGTGKTTALQVAARAIEAEGGRMIGLAPSAAAADVMADAIGIEANTIHSFTHGHGTLAELLKGKGRIEGVDVKPGDVLVVDEAGMAGSTNLAKVTRIAERHGAHVRLIGDDRQLSAVEAGGALRLLEHEVGSVKLQELHRFSNREEAEATKLLRDPAKTGDPFAWYVDNGRVTGGSVDQMTADVFSGWQHDTDAGLQSVMVAKTNATVSELNARAQALRMSQGVVKGRESAPLHDGLSAYRGDTIVTRQNDSQLKVNVGRDRVKNNDVWTVEKAHQDGSLSVTGVKTGAKITLPTEYVAKSVELGYASTLHRTQGMTADTAHVLADSSTSRELAYVGLTRGKHENHLYVETEQAQPVSDVLASIARTSDAALSATETIRGEQARVDNLVTLIDQYGDVAERADVIRFEKIADERLGVAIAAELRGHDSWGAVEAGLRRAEAAGLDPADTLDRAWHQRDMTGAEDQGAVLASRITDATDRQTAENADKRPQESSRVPGWIADRRPLDSEHTAPEWREHLAERYDYLETRLEERGQAIAAEPPQWALQLGDVPVDDNRRAQWTQLAAEVDVFRERYRVPADAPEAIPAEYRQRPVGADLAARVTELNGSKAIRDQTPAVSDDRQQTAPRAEETDRRAREAAAASSAQQSAAAVPTQLEVDSRKSQQQDASAQPERDSVLEAKRTPEQQERSVTSSRRPEQEVQPDHEAPQTIDTSVTARDRVSRANQASTNQTAVQRDEPLSAQKPASAPSQGSEEQIGGGERLTAAERVARARQAAEERREQDTDRER
ncbi:MULTISPECIES: MobF family relaxase [unclassified Frondihabitans]|uniref:MobF family relaxase n=1 Tax=unclassified Frondihabitans TaxID=2626248 RepID=UPI000F4D8FF9|nr:MULTISPECIES: MobF family relaxase [unclassified Frondihabitans]RPE73743.1 conjugative relaxase-like TrwC/TraI family protein [Frondihabitans sp. PhB153]RPF02120.1 conjugative relaxase-like TrwC/TraI family protein [Frondihabitans sp. PhB161]